MEMHENDSTPPRLAITMGDPAGIGPENVVAAWLDPRVHAACRPVAFGHPTVLQRAITLRQLPLRLQVVRQPEEATDEPGVLACLACVGAQAVEAPAARISAAGGESAYQAVLAAVQAVQAGSVHGLVTAPLHKAALQLAGHRYPGHTELLAELAGVRNFAMMLHVPPHGRVPGPAGLNVVHVTLHLALRDALAQLDSAGIVSKAQLVHTATSQLLHAAGQQRPPRLAVCALNPHAGEEGLFGHEETTLIAPAVVEARRRGLDLQGPFPADTLMLRAIQGAFDAVVALYHDQGHIPIKLWAWREAVNVTLGLPFTRTSVAHGTAFDLAWQGTAHADSLIQAILTCSALTGFR